MCQECIVYLRESNEGHAAMLVSIQQRVSVRLSEAYPGNPNTEGEARTSHPKTANQSFGVAINVQSTLRAARQVHSPGRASPPSRVEHKPENGNLGDLALKWAHG